MILRPYQETTTDALRAGLRTQQAGLLVQPCGSGKGTQIADIVNRTVARGKRVIFTVHGKALVHDMSERVTRLGIKHGVLMGSMPRQHWHPVQVASIDTLHRMEHPPGADLIIADEAHMALSATWRKTIARYPAAKLIGCTATPCRLDGQGLGRASGGLFDFLVLGPNEQELIDMGYLVPSRVLAPPPPADLGAVKKTAGEFNAKQQATVCDKAKVIGDIVQHWKQHGNVKTAAFAVDQAHANHIAEQFREAGVNWAYVDAETPDDERARIWKDLDTGDLMGVSSVGCIAVGWDHSVVSCIIAARKTASLGLWRQILGRGSRTHPGKTHFLVLDHVGNTHHHEPYGMFEDAVDWSLDGNVLTSGADKPDNISTCKQSVRDCPCPAEFTLERFPGKHDSAGIHWPCYATFKTGPRECPYCGNPKIKTARDIEVVDAALTEVKKFVILRPHDTEDQRRAAFDRWTLEGTERGYKPGWAAWKYKSTYGAWPPTRAWSVRRALVSPTHMMALD